MDYLAVSALSLIAALIARAVEHKIRRYIFNSYGLQSDRLKPEKEETRFGEQTFAPGVESGSLNVLKVSVEQARTSLQELTGGSYEGARGPALRPAGLISP